MRERDFLLKWDKIFEFIDLLAKDCEKETDKLAIFIEECC